MFSIKESLKYGWQKSKENMELILYATLLILAVGWLAGGLSPIGLIIVIFMIIVRMGYTKIFLRMHDGESPKFGDIFKEYRTFWRYLGTCILYSLVITGGLILFVIPGIFWAARFSLALIVVIDTKMGPIKSMKESYAITKGSFWKLLWFWIVVSLINILGLLLAGVGLLLTIPVTTFASIQIYRLLSQKRVPLVSTSSPQAA
jgi:uncharacterized membrane protein